MNTKEAIKFSHIDFLKAIKEFVTKEFYNPPGIKDINKRIDQVIELLQRGEKYKAIVKDVKIMLLPSYFIDHAPELDRFRGLFKETMQKHFPKAVSKSERINNIIVRLSVYNSLGKMTEIIELLRELREEEVDNESIQKL